MDTVEKQLAEAFAEAKENPSKDNVIVVQREEVKMESPTLEEKSSDAGLSDSVGEKKGGERDPEDRGDAPVVISTHREAEPVSEALQNEMPTEVPPVENDYPPEAPPRNWEAEWKELADAHPEVVGKELPGDIYRACLQGDKPPLRVYESMMLEKQAEEIETLRQQIATLRQNAESASRAPVSAVTGGGAGAEPEDPFVAAFRRFM